MIVNASDTNFNDWCKNFISSSYLLTKIFIINNHWLVNEKKITSIVLNNFINESRVLKENISLKNAGYSTQVVALHEDALKEYEKILRRIYSDIR